MKKSHYNKVRKAWKVLSKQAQDTGEITVTEEDIQDMYVIMNELFNYVDKLHIELKVFKEGKIP